MHYSGYKAAVVGNTVIKEMPRRGVGVIILHDDKVLLGKRKGSLGAGTWAFPGGHQLNGENVNHCAIREVAEETGLDIKVIAAGPCTDDYFTDQGKHYKTQFVVAESATSGAAVLEPDKCEQWAWYDWDELPQPLFKPVASLLKLGFSPDNRLAAQPVNQCRSKLEP